MLELLLLWKLSDVREELRDYDSEDMIGAAALFVMAQIIVWPLLLGAFLGKKLGWRFGVPISAATAIVLLVVNWGLYIVVGFAAALVAAIVLIWYLTFAE